MPEITPLFDDFIFDQKTFRNSRPATITGYEAAFKLLCQYSPSIALTDLTEGTMRGFFKHLDQKAQKRDGKELKASTIATYRAKLNTFFTWLEKQKNIDKNPLRHLPKPKIDYEDKKYLNGNDVSKILTTVDHGIKWQDSFTRARNSAIFATFFYTGVRRSELLGLRVSDLDFQRRSIHINGNTSKSRRDRQVPMNAKLVLSLQDYMDHRLKKNYSNPHLFASSESDRRLSQDGLKHMVEKVKRESGVKFHNHRWRHTFAINLLNQGTDISKLRQLLGHKDITMTAQYLRQIPQKALKGDIDALNLHDLL